MTKQGHLQQAAEDLVQAGLEYLQRRRLHNLPGQPVPVLRYPQSEEVLPHVQVELPMLQFVTCTNSVKRESAARWCVAFPPLRRTFSGGCPLLRCALLPSQTDTAVRPPPVPPA